jgi:hypothetical protein
LTSIQDLEAIFGQLDRGLERKGSFFHRTISKMLETTPVFAMNLLLTDDNLDVIEYKSLSSSSGYDNDILREGPYRRFFDTTGFWKRDTESFINLTKPNLGYNERAFNLTNLSDRAITAFVFKSKLTGFDRTMLEWYGSVDKMPPYVNEQDYASDYLVDVVVVGGDWSNYQDLAVDPRWSAYFNSSGLRKDQVRNFANDRNVNLLSYYEGLSLIPYFRDLNGRNIFIETVINRDTDRTGLFCAFNNDLIEVDAYNGLLDLLGNTIIGRNETDINFLSYREMIAESVEVTSTPLDLPGNVTAILGGTAYGYSIAQNDHAFGGDFTGGVLPTGRIENANNRTAWFGEGSVYGVVEDATSLTGTMSISVDYNVMSDAFVVIGDTYIPLESGTVNLSIDSSDYPTSSSTQSYASTFIINNTGSITQVVNLSPFTGNNFPPVAQSDIVLGYVVFQITPSGEIANAALTRITIDGSGFMDLQHGVDYQITSPSGGSLKIEFLGTNTQQSVNNYAQYRRFKMFNRLVNLIDNPNKNRMVMNLSPDNTTGEKFSLDGVSISNIVTTTFQNKAFTLSGFGSADLTEVLNGYLVLYTVDNEFILGSDSVVTKNGLADATEGVVARYSRFYSRFFDGIINTRDFFYANRLYVDNGNFTNSLLGDTVDVTFIDGEDTPAGPTSSFAGNDYIIFQSSNINFASLVDFQTFEQIIFPDSNVNKGAFTIINAANPVGLANDLGYLGAFAYQVNEEVDYEELFNISLIFNNLKKHYLKMYLEGNGALQVEFVDETLETTESVNIEANDTFYVQSRKSNLKQTLEIEVPTGYVQVPNKILVNGARYTEVKVGDFLEAFVDPTELEVGEVPRKATRILSKRQFAGDPSLVEITCDSRIRRYNFAGDLQTMRYVSIDNYASTYKAIKLKGFRVRQASLPDGTEAKQNQILNLVAKGTPMFKAVTNKEAIDFRYLVDSFGLGLTERSKQQLVDICGDRLDVFGFINMPSLRQFKNSSSPSFVDSEGTLQTEFIAKGGDPESNPAFLYSFGEGAGTTCVGYFTPYVNVNDNGRPIDVPPASYVATTYMRKHISNITSVTPWTIAAGVNNGRITNINSLEMDFTPEDIEFLNGAQMNPLVFKRNRGFVIETENTGQTLVRSALSFIHVREVLIELERELSRMLLDYQWRYNTPDVRAEIKLRADVICETYVSKNGLFNYFNKMDDENNTPDIIDNQIGVIDTYVEPIRGMGIIVNNITILRTGAISAGGFINP